MQSTWGVDEDEMSQREILLVYGQSPKYNHHISRQGRSQDSDIAGAFNTSGSKASSAQINHHQGGTDIPQVAENMKQQTLFDKLPEDILHRIHSLLPIQDAACAACVSHAFLRSWRCYSKLILNDCALGLNHIEFEERKIYLIDKVDKILKNHHDKGVKVETLNLILTPCTNIKASYLDRWLRRTVKSGFKDLYLEMPLSMKKIYKFPCSVLSDEGAASSIQFLNIGSCTFHPTSTLGSLARLKTHLKILDVQLCNMLRVVEIDAPNLCYFNYDSALPEIYNANTPLLQSRLPHLKNLEIRLRAVLPKGSPPSYDFFSLVSFLDASPALESFTLHVNEYVMKHYPVVGDNYECPRQKLDLSHNRLRHMTITGFCSANSLVELTVHILESTHSLERLTLDTTYDYNRCIQGPGADVLNDGIASGWGASLLRQSGAHPDVSDELIFILTCIS
uniref:F-box domain-containing protein n=1 Tax=Aegilops tauschii TaxID=37682 RepID=M8C0F4_AEGTA